MQQTNPKLGLDEYNSVLRVFAIESTPQACNTVFEEMLKAGHKPDETTFTLLLQAQRDDRVNLFKVCTLMFQNNVKPNVQMEWILVTVISVICSIFLVFIKFPNQAFVKHKDVEGALGVIDQFREVI